MWVFGLNEINGELLYRRPKDISRVLKRHKNVKITNTQKNVRYLELVCSFDIETSSFYAKSTQSDNEKVAIMYEWTLAIDKEPIIGRTWEEFIECIEKITEFYELDDEKRLIIYVHNLAFEFQFIRKLFEWDRIFSLKKRKPIQAVTDGIEFRCSYILSGYSVEKLGEQLIKYKVSKLVGNLDYKLVRTPITPLTRKELEYCINDCMVVNAYIQETIERLGSITKIPLTKTGYVRRYTREMCLYENGSHKKNTDKYKKYHKFISRLTLDQDTYIKLKEAFAGGFTHANAEYACKTLENVSSFDFTSSYPAVMISEKFPMSKFKEVEIESEEQFQDLLDTKCCLFEVEIWSIEAIIDYENYISVSHCRKLRKCVENNGRVYSAEHLLITLTEQDYFIIERMYKWENLEIVNFRFAEKAYLPKPIIQSILTLYSTKTELKEVEGKESEYMRAKENINSEFGMTCTDICRDEIEYIDGEWLSTQVDIIENLEKYNKSVKRFLYYPWGIWVTAYARANLFTGIFEFGEDYIYSDTDSLKVFNVEKHMKYIESYNKMIIKKIKKCIDFYGLDIRQTRPKNILGEEKQLGIWDNEGTYTRFKTLGAKRYMVEKNNKISITVSGVNKKNAVPYLTQTYGKNIFEKFDNELDIPAEYKDKLDNNVKSATGKLTHTYIDDERIGVVKDYMGSLYEYYEKSGTHLEPTGYCMSLSQKYVDFILSIEEEDFG